MKLNIDEFKETIEINKDDLENNKAIVNELIVDDLLITLGYNKKKDRAVKRVYDGLVDWEIIYSNYKLAVVTFSASTEINAETYADAANFCAEARYSILLVVNGLRVKVLRFNKETMTYTEVSDISLVDETDDLQTSVLDAISKDGFNMEFIDALLKPKTVTVDELVEALDSHKQELTESFATFCDTEIDSVVDATEEVFSRIHNEVKETASASVDTAEENVEATEEDAGVDTEKVAELEATIENLQSELTSTRESLAELQDEHKKSLEEYAETLKVLEETKASIPDTTTESNESLAELESTKQKLAELQSSYDNNKVHSDELQLKVDQLTKSLDEANEKIESLQVENNGESSGLDVDAVRKYEDKIREISVKLADNEEIIKSLKEELKKKDDQINNFDGAKLKEAQELLNVIEDDPDSERNYVGVLYKEIMQFEKIYTFVGRIIQKLYDKKGLEASRYIFDADVFKIVQPAVRNDLLLGNKAYDLDLSGLTEDEILNKLRILMSHFEDAAFLCKKVGREPEKLDTENIKHIAEPSIKPAEADEVIGTDLGSEADNQFQNQFASEVESEAVEDSNNDSHDTFSDQTPDEEQPVHALLVQNLSNIDSLVWTDEPVTFNNIKYIGNNDINFAINLDGKANSYDNMLCKCIDAILALQAENQDKNIITSLKSKDFSRANNAIKVYSPDCAGKPRINGTKFVIDGVQSVQQAATILVDICKIMGIDTDEIYVYLDADTTSKLIYGQFGYTEESVLLKETDYFKPSDNDRKLIAYIKGDMYNNILVTKNSLRAHKDVLLNVEAVNKFGLIKLEGTKDLAKVIQVMLQKLSDDHYNIDCNTIGNVIGENYRIVSTDESAVGRQHEQINVNGTTYYVSVVEPWQLVHCLVKAQISLFRDSNIVLKTLINADAANFYSGDFETTEPSLSLAIKSFVNYVGSCVHYKNEA